MSEANGGTPGTDAIDELGAETVRGGNASPPTDRGLADRTKEEGEHKKCRGHRKKMDRVTFRLPREKLDEMDGLVEEDEYRNMSEAMRTAVDTLLLAERDG